MLTNFRMKTKIFLQLILFFFTLLIVLITFNIYFNNNDGDNENLSTLQKKSGDILRDVASNNNKDNLIKDIFYLPALLTILSNVLVISFWFIYFKTLSSKTNVSFVSKNDPKNW